MILLICFVPVVLVLLILLITRKWANPYKLYLIFGKKGSGKSTYLCKLAIKYLLKGWIIYTNMQDLAIPGVRLIDVDLLGDFVPVSHSLLLLDEVGMIWDNRNFKSFKPSVRDFFKLQRHYRVITYLASQTFDIDKKLRDLTDGMILFCNLLNVFSIGRPIKRHVTLTESTSEAESRIAEDLKFTPIWTWKVSFIPKWASLFQSFKVPDMPKLPFEELTSSKPIKQLRKLKNDK